MTDKPNYDELINSLISTLKTKLQGVDSKTNRDKDADKLVSADNLVNYTLLKKKKEVPFKKRRERAVGSEFKKMKESKMTIASLVNSIANIDDTPIESEVTKIDNKDINKPMEKTKAKRGRKPKKAKAEEPLATPEDKSAPIDIPKKKEPEPAVPAVEVKKTQKELKKEKAAERKQRALDKKKKAAERKAKRTPEQQKKIDERMAKIRSARNLKKAE
jgi:hypothetical protein